MRGQQRGEALRLIIRAIQIADQHHKMIVRRTAQRGFEHVIERDVALCLLGGSERMIETHHFVQQAQCYGLVAFRADFDQFGFVENDATDPIAGSQRTPGSEGGELRGDDGFHRPPAAEKHGRALIYDEQDRTLALLAIDANMGRTATRGCAQFLERDTATAQPRGMPPRKQRMDRLPWQKRKVMRIRFQHDQFVECDANPRAHGVAHTETMVSSSFSITSVRVLPAASAS